MATSRPGISVKIINLYYDMPVKYRRPLVYTIPFTLYWTGSIQWISSLVILVGLGNGDVGNNDQNVTSLCSCKHLYIV